MSNDYYNNESAELTTGETAEATDLETKFDEVVTGFAKLPDEDELNRGTICFAEDSGAANAYVVTMHQTASSYIDGMEIIMEVSAACTGASTLNVDSIGAKSIKHGNGDDTETGDLPAGSMVHLRYHEDDDCFYILGSDQFINRINALQTSIAALVAGSGCPVSANDTSAGYLNGKLVAGTGVSLTEGSDGGDETLTIAASTTFPTGTIVGTTDTQTLTNKTIPALLGAQTIYIPAGAMTSRETSGASSGSEETTTNKVMIETLDFDATSDEFAQFSVRMPKSWDAGTVTAQFIWSHAATTTNFGVRFFIQGLALVNDDAIDTAFGTAQGHTADTGGTTDDLYITDFTPAITISNTPAKSDEVIFQVYRDVSDAGDTLAVDARLHGVVLVYNTDDYTDD